MLKPLILLATLLLAGAAAVAQEPAMEFGDVSELAKLSKVYVYCEDLKIRQKLVNELKKEPALEVVGRVEDAEFMVSYTYRYTTFSRDNGIFGTRHRTSLYDGDLLVTVAGTVEPDQRVHQRLVWSISKDRQKGLGKNPYEKGVRAFLDDYRRVHQ